VIAETVDWSRAMYTVVRRYTNASQLFDTLQQRQADVEQLIRGVKGFVAYSLIRSGDGGASITFCEDRAGSEESSRVAAEWVRQNVPAAAGRPPEVTEGEVLFQFWR